MAFTFGIFSEKYGNSEKYQNNRKLKFRISEINTGSDNMDLQTRTINLPNIHSPS